MLSGFFYLNSLDRFISSERVSSKFLLLPWFTEIHTLNANSVDPDQMPHSAASDLGLYCLPMSLLLDARPKSVKFYLAIGKWSDSILNEHVHVGEYNLVLLCSKDSDQHACLNILRKYSNHKSKYILRNAGVWSCFLFIKYSWCSLSWRIRDSLKYFEISVPRHINFAKLRKNKSNNHISQINM